jgi:hypothetical protein
MPTIWRSISNAAGIWSSTNLISDSAFRTEASVACVGLAVNRANDLRAIDSWLIQDSGERSADALIREV